jgi:outer membrane protein assembly factor BamA
VKLLLLTVFSFSAFAFEISVSGNSRTDTDVVITELSDLMSAEISPEIIKEAKRRIWNLRLFSSVEIIKFDNTLKIEVTERWTTIPIAKFSSGGDTTYFALGAYDINTLGQNLELGAQYEELNERPAGVVWFRKPQFIDNRNLNIGMDFWTINRIRLFYDTKGEEVGAYTLIRKRVNTFLEYKWDDDFYLLGAQFDFHNDEVSEFGLSNELIQKNLSNDLNFKGSSINKIYKVYFRLGRVNFQNYLVDGTDAKIESSLVSTSTGDETLSDSIFTFRHYTLFDNNMNFAWQFSLESTNLENIQYQKFVGGFSEVRGYKDGQFYDQAIWKNNLEFRFDVLENKIGVIQGAVFSDQAKEGKNINDSFNSSNEVLLSSGFGIRLISPQIFRFVARLDYAMTHTRYVDQSISFGIQQFF